MHVWGALLELGGGAVQAPDNLELAERSALQKKNARPANNITRQCFDQIN